MADNRPICSHAKRDGSPCRTPALPGKDACYFHDPESAEARRAARQQGGTARSRRAAVMPGAPDVAFGCVADVTELLAKTAGQVRRGELDCRVGNCLAYIAATALRSIQQGDIEARLKAIEEELAAAREAKQR